jgi:hypothetical protein
MAVGAAEAFVGMCRMIHVQITRSRAFGIVRVTGLALSEVQSGGWFAVVGGPEGPDCGGVGVLSGLPVNLQCPGFVFVTRPHVDNVFSQFPRCRSEIVG